MKRSLAVVLGLCISLLGLPARAQTAPKKMWSVTYNPVTTLFWLGASSTSNSSPHPFSVFLLELAGEYRVSDKLGAAGLLGAGSFSYKEPGVTGGMPIIVGAQGRYYLFGDFDHGMQLGPHVKFTRLPAQSAEMSSVKGAASFLELGGFLGYKIVADFGLTFDLQLGPAYWIATASARDTAASNPGSSKSDSIVAFVARANIGWSF